MLIFYKFTQPLNYKCIHEVDSIENLGTFFLVISVFLLLEVNRQML